MLYTYQSTQNKPNAVQMHTVVKNIVTPLPAHRCHVNNAADMGCFFSVDTYGLYAFVPGWGTEVRFQQSCAEESWLCHQHDMWNNCGDISVMTYCWEDMEAAPDAAVA